MDSLINGGDDEPNTSVQEPQPILNSPLPQQHFCYIIADESGKTYNGYTINIDRRLKQHNRELCGGAKATGMGKNWYYIAILSGFTNSSEALSCEWKIKHPTNKRVRPLKYCKPDGRIKSLNLVLQLETWTAKSVGLSSGNPYTLFVKPEFMHLVDRTVVRQNVTIKPIEELFEKQK